MNPYGGMGDDYVPQTLRPGGGAYPRPLPMCYASVLRTERDGGVAGATELLQLRTARPSSPARKLEGVLT
ncbi:hypothetical protein BT69DRAFT_1285032 [Atractiella rhizophila]|nr:hypothetical protein BT69DRAFT_1285032 [Atractiella rhizophila]